MTNSFQVLETVEAPQTSQWLNNLLAPAAAALGLKAPPPIHFTSLGPWAGVSDGSDQNPQRRISFSPRVKLFRRSAIVELWAHELCHRVLQDLDPDIEHGHDAAFFCLQSCCFLRLQKAGVLAGERCSDWLDASSFYDLQDKPISGPMWDSKPLSKWLPQCIEWSLKTAEELACDTQFTGMEQVAHEVLRRYEKWQQWLLQEPKRLAIEKASIESREREHAGLRAGNRQLVHYNLVALGGFVVMSFLWVWTWF